MEETIIPCFKKQGSRVLDCQEANASRVLREDEEYACYIKQGQDG
jgi:hypothetical protein